MGKLSLWSFIAVAAVAFLLVAISPYYFAIPLPPAGNDVARIGPLGDFVGGILNPTLTFLTLMVVLYTSHTQSKELKLTQDQTRTQILSSARQNFESTFFNLIDLHSSIVGSMDTEAIGFNGPEKVHGRDCFKVFLEELSAKYKDNEWRMAEATERDRTVDAFSRFYNSNKQDLGHYFRTLHNIMRFVQEAELPALGGEIVSPKQKYMRIFRAQLSDYELAIIFYNCLHGEGKKMIRYASTYDIFNNLPPDLLLDPTHFDEFPELGSLAQLEGED